MVPLTWLPCAAPPPNTLPSTLPSPPALEHPARALTAARANRTALCRMARRTVCRCREFIMVASRLSLPERQSWCRRRLRGQYIGTVPTKATVVTHVNSDDPFAITERTRTKRLPERGHYDRDTVYAILDAGLI